jgi:hypothetical protein
LYRSGGRHSPRMSGNWQHPTEPLNCLWILGLADVTLAVDEINTKHLARRSVVAHIGVSGIHQQAGRRICGYPRSRPDLEVRRSTIRNKAEFAADAENLFQESLLVPGVLAFNSQPNGIAAWTSRQARMNDH